MHIKNGHENLVRNQEECKKGRTSEVHLIFVQLVETRFQLAENLSLKH